MDLDKQKRVKELVEAIAQQQMECHQASGTVRYHMHVAAHALYVLFAAWIVASFGMFFVPLFSLEALLCVLLNVVGVWNCFTRGRVVGFFLQRQGEEIKKLEDLAWEHAKLTGMEPIFNMLRMGMLGLGPRED